jgi:16S rRNA (adenine1518-N6/adenine1519-N6)-dimethyltransferase
MANTKDIVKKYGFRFTKSLGQNFLVDETILEDIVKGAEVCGEDIVIEIGPGVGTLTRELLKKAGKVYAVELDSKLIPILEEELKEFENFTLIHEDALKFDFNKIIEENKASEAYKNIKIVANLPYYVTTPIITRLISSGYNFKSLTIMIQKEVGERITARPGGKDYGAFSLLAQYYCDTRVVRKVPPRSFIPEPKVDSLVVRLDILPTPKVKVLDEKFFFRVVREAFNMRRKTLWNALKPIGIDPSAMEVVYKNSGIDPKRRGETLSIQEFAALSNEIYTIKS